MRQVSKSQMGYARWINWSLLFCLVLLSLLAIYLVGNSEKDTTDSDNCEHVIGAVFPLTGELSGFGISSWRGLKLAFEEQPKTGDECKILLIVENGKGNVSSSISAYSRLVSAGAQIIVTNISGISLALKERAKKDDVLLFADASHPGLTPKLEEVTDIPKVFRHSSVAYQESKVFIEALRLLNEQTGSSQRVAIGALNNDYGISLLDAIDKEISQMPEESRHVITSRVRFDSKDTEFLAVARYITEKKPNAIILVGYSRSLGLLINELRDGGYRGEIIASVGLTVTADAINVAQDNAEGIIFNAFEIQEDDDQYKEFQNFYNEKYEETPPQTSVLMYNTGLLLRKVLADTQTKDTKKVAKKIIDLASFQGAGETMTININGDVLPQLIPARYSKKGIQPLRKQE